LKLDLDQGVGDATVVVVSVLSAGAVVAIGLDSAGAVASAVAIGEASAGEVVVMVVSVLSAGEAAGAAVSFLFSHATRSAAPARMQIYFFIGYG
jgi:hypothetical protein